MALLPVYKKYDIEVEKAQGCHIWDTSGKRYADFLSGISVTNLGHRPAGVVEAVNRVAGQYMHLSNLFHEKYQKQLASMLSERILGGRVFFSNSGAEANENAVKIARKFFKGRKYEVISFVNSFHGRTLAMISATGQNKFREGFGPMPEGFVHAEYNYLASVEDKISSRTCAVLVETIQGEGGINVADRDFMEGLRNLCDEEGILLIADEVQTGLGRTGKMMGYEHYGIEPDIVTLGKSLGGGLPLAATVYNPVTAECAEPGDLGSTFGGNPVCCAAGMAVLEALDENMISEVSRKGDYFRKQLEDLASRFGDIEEVRGTGLMLGIRLHSEGSPLVEYLLDHGFIVNCTQEHVIRFLPPFIVPESTIEEIVDVMEKYFKERG